MLLRSFDKFTPTVQKPDQKLKGQPLPPAVINMIKEKRKYKRLYSKSQNEFYKTIVNRLNNAIKREFIFIYLFCNLKNQEIITDDYYY